MAGHCFGWFLEMVVVFGWAFSPVEDEGVECSWAFSRCWDEVGRWRFVRKLLFAKRIGCPTPTG
jgi:hypothetical protein